MSMSLPLEEARAPLEDRLFGSDGHLQFHWPEQVSAD